MKNVTLTHREFVEAAAEIATRTGRPVGDVAAVEADLDRLGLAHWRIGQVVPAGEGERLRIG